MQIQKMPKALHRRERNRESDARRNAALPTRKLYGTARWQALREAQLRKQPLCERHKAKGEVVKATVAHHVIRHNGNTKLFWYGELASSCKSCHDAVEQAIEAKGYEMGCDEGGRPIASDHPWNSKK